MFTRPLSGNLPDMLSFCTGIPHHIEVEMNLTRGFSFKEMDLKENANNLNFNLEYLMQ